MVASFSFPNQYFIVKLMFRCEQLAEIVWQSRQQIKRLQLQRAQLPFHNQRDMLSEQDTTITDLLLELIARFFNCLYLALH